MEKTIELEIPILLPGINDDQDQCLIRLETALCNHKGILRAHLEREKTPVGLCLHYDPNSLNLSEVKRMAVEAGTQIVNRFHHDSIAVEGMDCSDCVIVLEHCIGRMEGVLSVNANYATEKLWIEYDNQKVNRRIIEHRIRSLGYKTPQNKAQEKLQENRELLFSLGAGFLLLVGWLGGILLKFPDAVSVAFYLAAYLLGGWDVARHAWHALRERHFDTDLLMVMAALGAAVLGDFAEGALLLFLFSLGHSLEERTMEKARAAVEALADLAPKTALVRRDEKEIEIPVESLQLEELVIVRPSVRIPVDGIILKGRSGVDQSSVTGESMPVDKVPGDQVFAGTINGEGALEVKVRRLAKDSTLSRIMSMVEEAQAQKSPTQQTVERFERVFVPAVLIGTALMIVVPPLFGLPFRESFLRAMTLLVAASPCALALGTPAAVLAGIAQAARNGVLIKGGAHLENLGRIKAIAFDKTGTVTHGKPEVTDLFSFGGDERNLIAIAAGAESRSGHPLARAVFRKAQTEGIEPAIMDSVESLTGFGLHAVKGGESIWLGNKALMESNQVTISPEVNQTAESFQEAGKTVIWVARKQVLLGLVALADTLRSEAAETMQELHKIGVPNTIMLTGDHSNAAAAIANEVGISNYRSDMMPDDKLSIIKELVNQYGQVAMIGDGVNDAPALANATVGIAMGGSGTDVALETADVALMGDDLSLIPFAVGLGRAARAIIVQNLAISLGVIGLLAIASVTGMVGIGIAVFFHEGSTIVVILNALRLLKYRTRR